MFSHHLVRPRRAFVRGALLCAALLAPLASQASSFMNAAPRYTSMSSLLQGVANGELAHLHPNSEEPPIMASVWQTLNTPTPFPGQFRDVSDALMLESTLMSVLHQINQATWAQVSRQAPDFGHGEIAFSDGQVQKLVQQRIQGSYALSPCGAAQNQCVQRIHQWLAQVAQASVRGAQQERLQRVEAWQVQQHELQARQRREREAQQARVRAEQDAENAAIAQRAQRIREQEAQKQEQRNTRVGG
ncbi:hypothetical protein E9531_13550 [Lampropedia puyangensis]|uniref:DUF3300 domain-containing protein n=1 Tax=Lampropedia puyangensis TaxID=1330072 RepID=A0A4S8EVZ2_9BURK|nr:hypothetical protein [Lampropedia puyangensis]THT98706.1 hypothetical protein E9531_13550 [Lampropedia puyangensis]